jgi:zinc protease
MRYDNDNFGRLYLEMNATAFIAHPYQFPVIGWSSDVENWTQQDLEDYFRTYYAPNNLTMVFTGDVTPEEVFGLAEQYFGGIPAQEPPQTIRTAEPEQQGERRLLVEVDSPTPLLHMTFHAGSATDPETLPLSVLLKILVGGDSSRLHRLFVEDEQIALAVGGFQMEGFDPGLVYFYLTLPPGADVAAVERRTLAELDRIASEGVTAAELEKARNIMIADYWRGLATIDGKASALGNAEVFLGDYQRAFSVPDELAGVTAEQLQQVAAAVFDHKQMTVGVLRSPAEEDSQ